MHSAGFAPPNAATIEEACPLQTNRDNAYAAHMKKAKHTPDEVELTPEQRMKSRDAAIRELLRLLPPEGADFPVQRRIIWLNAVGYILMAYHGTVGELKITEDKN